MALKPLEENSFFLSIHLKQADPVIIGKLCQLLHVASISEPKVAIQALAVSQPVEKGIEMWRTKSFFFKEVTRHLPL